MLDVAEAGQAGIGRCEAFIAFDDLVQHCLGLVGGRRCPAGKDLLGPQPGIMAQLILTAADRPVQPVGRDVGIEMRRDPADDLALQRGPVLQADRHLVAPDDPGAGAMVKGDAQARAVVAVVAAALDQIVAEGRGGIALPAIAVDHRPFAEAGKIGQKLGAETGSKMAVRSFRLVERRDLDAQEPCGRRRPGGAAAGLGLAVLQSQTKRLAHRRAGRQLVAVAEVALEPGMFGDRCRTVAAGPMMADQSRRGGLVARLDRQDRARRITAGFALCRGAGKQSRQCRQHSRAPAFSNHLQPAGIDGTDGIETFENARRPVLDHQQRRYPPPPKLAFGDCQVGVEVQLAQTDAARPGDDQRRQIAGQNLCQPAAAGAQRPVGPLRARRPQQAGDPFVALTRAFAEHQIAEQSRHPARRREGDVGPAGLQHQGPDQRHQRQLAACGRRTGPFGNPVERDLLDDVLQGRLADRLESIGACAAQRLVRALRQHTTAGQRLGLDAGGDVDGVAIDCAVDIVHVADMNPDPEPCPVSGSALSLGNHAMQFHAEFHGADGAIEQHQVAVAGDLYQRAAEPRRQFRHQRAAGDHEFERADLVAAHECAVADKVGEEHGALRRRSGAPRFSRFGVRSRTQSANPEFRR